jgi:hypothetical protein
MSNGSDVVRSSKALSVAEAANRRRQSLVVEPSVQSKPVPKQTQQQQRQNEEADSSSYFEEARPKSSAGADRGRSAASNGHRSATHRHQSASKHADSDEDMDDVDHTHFQQKMAAGYAPPDDEDEEEDEDEDQNYRRPKGHQPRQFEEDDDDKEDGDYEEGVGLDGSAELIQKTVGLLSAHKLSIAEMVEVSCVYAIFVLCLTLLVTGDEGGDGVGAGDGECGRPRLGAVH